MRRDVATSLNLSRGRNLVLVTVSLALIACVAGPAFAHLILHPDNPHYFLETTTGKPVMICGFYSIVPNAYGYDPVDNANEIKSYRTQYSRVWHLLSWDQINGIWPWGKSTTPGGYYGGYKWDFNTWNSAYWGMFHTDISLCEQGDVYAEIMLFDRCSMSPSGMDRWGSNPWASDNNINSLETPAGSADGTPAFYAYSTKPNLRNQQERWIRKMIDETIGYENIIYEVENEHWEDTNTSFGDHYGQFVKDYISSNYPTQPRLVSYNSLETDLHGFYTLSSVDIVNKHYGSEFESDQSIANTYLEAEWPHNKATNIDEFANGVTDYNILRKQCWTIITSGGNFHIEDANLSAKPWDVIENIRSFKEVSGWSFVDAAPNKNLISSGSGYCMRDSGIEYVNYFPTGGSKTFTLAAGDYTVRWWNPRTGGYYSITSFSHAGGAKTMSTPDSNDWVMHARLQSLPLPAQVVESKPAGSITVDGSSSDWNLGDFSTRIPAGSVGTGSIAVVGYDPANNVCYQGNHGSGKQYPPTNPTDFAAKVYSRNDASYLYFLVRVDDSDLRYNNPTSANWNNDCIEIYIDPSHNHGSTALSNSTSDIQLDIDANNQKNVYCTTSGYATQVLAGVTSAVVRDGTGYWIEARISKTALDPDLPATGTIGIDFFFRDNDNNNDNAQTTLIDWCDPSSSTFASKVPDRWGHLDLQGTVDTTPPGPVSNFTATAGAGQVILGWTNPTDGDFTGTLVRFKTTGYPTSTTDGTLVIDKSGTPGAADGTTHTNLTGGVTYYYSAWSHDGVPNYATTKRDASATPTSNPITISNSPFTSGANGWTFAGWKASPTQYQNGTIARVATGGNPDGCVLCNGYGTGQNTDRCMREGGEMTKVITTAGYSGIRFTYDLKVNDLGTEYIGAGTGTCSVDHNLIDEQLTVYYSTNGGSSWTECDNILRSALLAGYQSYGNRSVNLTGVSACNNNANFALKFRWQLNTVSDSAWLDRVVVTADQ